MVADDLAMQGARVPASFFFNVVLNELNTCQLAPSDPYVQFPPKYSHTTSHVSAEGDIGCLSIIETLI